MNSFGKRERKSPDWFEASIEEIEPAINAKRAALMEHKRKQSQKTLDAYRAARNTVKRIV